MILTVRNRLKLRNAQKNLNMLIKAFDKHELIDRKIARSLMKNLENIHSAVSDIELDFHQRLIEEVEERDRLRKGASGLNRDINA